MVILVLRNWKCIMLQKCFLGAFLLVMLNYLSNGQEHKECKSVEYIGNPFRSPFQFIENEEERLCDSHLNENKWYDFGGELTSECPQVGRCGTFSGVWYPGIFPIGTETIHGEVCGIDTYSNCCSWHANIEIKKCLMGYIYKIGIPTDCPRSYCVGELHQCKTGESYHKNTNSCLVFPEMKTVTIGQPYVSASKMVDSFKASAFSIQCYINIDEEDTQISTKGKLQVIVLFMVNKDTPGRFLKNFPASNVVINESALIGHIGKMIKCQAQLRYVFDDGSFSQQSNLSVSSSYMMEIFPKDGKGHRTSEIRVQQGEASTISLQSTFPLTAAHCLNSESCTLKTLDLEAEFNESGIKQDKCHFTFNLSSESQSSSVIRIMANTTPGAVKSKRFMVFKTYNSEIKDVLFQGLTLAPIKVIIDDQGKMPICRAIGTLYFHTFDDLKFDGYANGNFNLLSTAHRTMQIQIRQTPCFGAVACICGVLAREGNNLVGVNSCDNKRDPLAVELMRDNVNARAYIVKKQTDFKIILASGIQIDVLPYSANNATYLSLLVHGLKREQYGGICAAKSTPENLAIYKVSSSKSFFQKHLPSCVNEEFNFPSCKCNFKNTPATCELETPGAYENLIKLTNICDLKNVPQDSSEVPLKSAIATQGITLGYIFASIDNRTDNLKMVPSEHIGRQKALDHCNQVMKKSNSFIDCQSDSEPIIQKCADGVKFSGSVDVAENYGRVFEHSCVIKLKSQIEIVNDKYSPSSQDILNLLNKLENGFCPSCKNNGTCSDGTCKCKEGFAGLHCGIDLGKNPLISLAQENNFCDPAERPCYILNVETTLNDPQDASSVKCIVAIYSESGELQELEVVTKLLQPGYLQCVLDNETFNDNNNDGKTEFAVYNSFNNGKTEIKSNSLKVVIYNGTCLDCQDTSCRPKENTCFIEESCYEANQAKDDDLYCNPKLSQTQWSSIKEALTTSAKNKESGIVTKAQERRITSEARKKILPNKAEKLKFAHSVAMVGMVALLI